MLERQKYRFCGAGDRLSFTGPKQYHNTIKFRIVYHKDEHQSISASYGINGNYQVVISHFVTSIYLSIYLSMYRKIFVGQLAWVIGVTAFRQQSFGALALFLY